MDRTLDLENIGFVNFEAIPFLYPLNQISPFNSLNFIWEGNIFGIVYLYVQSITVC